MTNKKLHTQQQKLDCIEDKFGGGDEIYGDISALYDLINNTDKVITERDRYKGALERITAKAIGKASVETDYAKELFDCIDIVKAALNQGEEHSNGK